MILKSLNVLLLPLLLIQTSVKMTFSPILLTVCFSPELITSDHVMTWATIINEFHLALALSCLRLPFS